MIQDFPNGTLHLAQSPGGIAETSQVWTDNPLALFACILSAVCLVLAIRPLSGVWHKIVRGTLYGRTHIEIERNLSMKRNLTMSVVLLAVPTVSVFARFSVFGKDILSSIGLLAGYFILRAVIYRLLRHRKTDKDTWTATRRCVLPTIVLISVMTLVTFALWFVFKWDEEHMKIVFHIEIALCFLSELRQIAEILGLDHSRFSTFLYLCALEILPLSVFSAATVFLQR